VPAAAVIPALKMHRTIAAVKKLVVGSVPAPRSIARCALVAAGFPVAHSPAALTDSRCLGLQLYFEQIRVLKTGVSLECSCME
jgi:hypothetical protein